MPLIPPYIGDDAFRVFLERHDCPASIEEIRMRFLGAIVSPLRRNDIYPIVEEFFEFNMPEFPEMEEMGAFLQAFLGLWNEIAQSSRHVPISLSPVGNVATHEDLKNLLFRRMDEVVFGFLDGVWGEDNELPLTQERAAMLTAVEEMARTYDEWLSDVVGKAPATMEKPVGDFLRDIEAVDQTVTTGIASLVKAFRDDPSPDHPRMTRAKTLIETLAESERLPLDAIRQCLARRDEMVPIFLDILADYEAARSTIDDREDALFLIVHILGELGEQRAFAPLMDLLEEDAERLEAVLGDAITETLPNVLISVFDGNTDRLLRVMNNLQVKDIHRFGVFQVWAYLVAAGRIDRAEAERYLTSCFETLQPQGMDYVWTAWVETITYLGFSGLKELVRKAFDLGRIEPMSILFKEFEDLLERRLRSDDPMASLKKDGIYPFTDTIGVLSKWHSFSEEYLRRKKDAEEVEDFGWLPPVPVTNPIVNPDRHVGRNDPCPCGSGKKFKKCCLH
jgi:hypothetical protein